MQGRRVLALLLLLAPTCAPLPDYALPKVRSADPKQLAKRDSIAYRTLERGDFHGAKAPVPDASEASQMGAFTCADLVSQGQIELDLRQERQGGPFIARPRNAEVVARMDRDCSWWNPQQRESPAYVLQHEQIHFAIAELTARDVARRARQLTATGDSPNSATAAFQSEFDALFRAALDAMTARNTRFDLDTSGRHVPELQQRWFDQVSAELAH